MEWESKEEIRSFNKEADFYEANFTYGKVQTATVMVRMYNKPFEFHSHGFFAHLLPQRSICVSCHLLHSAFVNMRYHENGSEEEGHERSNKPISSAHPH
jgi:hypothetical protein